MPVPIKERHPEYTIVSSAFQHGAEEIVNQHLKRGWKPQGSLQVVPHVSRTRTGLYSDFMFFQALKKDL